jgi:hypothetical protein
MASIINAATSGGLITTADTSGILQLQTAGTTAVTVDASQNVTFVGSLTAAGLSGPHNGTVGATTPSTGAFTTLTTTGNVTLGDAGTDTILMNGAPSIGGAGYGMGMGFRNRIINGAMVIDQRNAGAEVSPAPSGYGLDRWATFKSGAGTWKLQQSTTAPAGFANSTLLTVTSASTPSGNDYYIFMQPIEGFNVADLSFGSASAQTVTLSFWVRSSVTGTFAGALRNSAENRAYPFTYTISSANTFEYKTITIAGDTSGTWLTTNGRGITLNLSLGGAGTSLATANAWSASGATGATGQTNWIATAASTFYITGVQLEKGATATAFDYRSYGTELGLCQRYYFAYAVPATCPQGFGAMQSTTAARIIFPNPVPMRAAPTFTSLGSLGIASGGTSFIASASSVLGISSAGVQMQFDVSGATTHQTCVYRDSGGTTFSAEL